MRTLMGYPGQDPLLLGITGSVYVAFALVAILGFMSPVKFAPVLLLQLCYKSIWFIVVLLPVIIAGSVPGFGWIFAGIFATYVIGDLVAIPFPIVFERETRYDSLFFWTTVVLSFNLPGSYGIKSARLLLRN